MAEAAAISLRAPGTAHLTASSAPFTPPSTAWLQGSWHVTHSTLPMWKGKRNVRITYTPLPSGASSRSKPAGSTPAGPTPAESTPAGSTAPPAETAGPDIDNGSVTRLNDVVSYQPLGPSAKVKTIHGVDTPNATVAGAWHWRGKGWLAIVSSHWQILGYGGGGGDGQSSAAATAASGQDQWVVTYFASTLFTPAGIDIYSRAAEGLSATTVSAIKDGLGRVEDADVKKLAAQLFEVKHDQA